MATPKCLYDLLSSKTTGIIRTHLYGSISPSLIYCVISIAIYKTFITFGQSLLDKTKPLMSNGELLF